MRKALFVLLVLLVGSPELVRAQTAWDAPLLLPPRPSPGVGIFLTDMHAGGLGVLGMYRPAAYGYGVRFGISDAAGDEDLAVFGGVDYNGNINTATTDFPLDIDWVVGAGLGASDGVRLSFPLGLNLGLSFQGEGARFIPFMSPRIILDAFMGREGRGNDMDLGFALDLGLDLVLRGTSPMAGNAIRFAGSLGDRSAVGIGIVF